MSKRRARPSDERPDARWVPAASDPPPPPVVDNAPDPVVEALPIAEGNGHKVGRDRSTLFCWHCPATGTVTTDERAGAIFTERCKR